MIKKLSNWKSDIALNRLLRNASVLMGGNLIAALITLITMAVTARALGPEGFGTLSLMTTYVMLVDRLLNFQSWQLLIRTGTQAIVNKNDLLLRQVLKFSVFLDVISALISALVAIAGSFLFVKLIDLQSEHVILTQIYSVTILFNLIGMPTGVLRIYNRFHFQASQKVLVACMSLMGAVVASKMGADLFWYICFAALSLVVGQVFIFVVGWQEITKQGHKGFMNTSMTGFTKSVPDAWQFVIYTNIESSVKIIRELDVFIIKVVLNVEAVGLYKLARQFADALNLLVAPFFQAVFPEVSRFVATGNLVDLRKLAFRSSIIVGGLMTFVWLVFVVFGSSFIHFFFGEGFEPAYRLSLICMFGIVIWGFAQPLSPILFSLGRIKLVFYIHFVTTLLYVLMLWVGLERAGLLGSVYAHTVFYLIWSLVMLVATINFLNKMQKVSL